MICEAMQAPSASTGEAAHTEAPEGRGNSAHPEWSILIAEDSPDNRMLLQAYLRTSPYRVTWVENGSAAVEAFHRNSYDLVLMDIQMPVMDGLTATRMIRTAESTRGSGAVPIIALTANSRPEDIQASYEAGCTAHLAKPISKQKLVATIEKLVPAAPNE
jgi:CheY-like chemotaxis protein